MFSLIGELTFFSFSIYYNIQYFLFIFFLIIALLNIRTKHTLENIDIFGTLRWTKPDTAILMNSIKVVNLLKNLSRKG